jgi:hypothetical protein
MRLNLQVYYIYLSRQLYLCFAPVHNTLYRIIVLEETAYLVKFILRPSIQRNILIIRPA